MSDEIPSLGAVFRALQFREDLRAVYLAALQGAVAGFLYKGNPREIVEYAGDVVAAYVIAVEAARVEAAGAGNNDDE
jgi:hypothetical protein